jgi:hypothetical protein
MIIMMVRLTVTAVTHAVSHASSGSEASNRIEEVRLTALTVQNLQVLRLELDMIIMIIGSCRYCSLQS